MSGGVAKDGIPALTDPAFISVSDARYLAEDSRVIGLRIGDELLAIPHNILWWHEIVNLNRGESQLAVTLCPLTGSSMAFDRDAIGGAEFGNSGLLFQNNLVMYDRNSEESLWPQMLREAGCGVRDREMLTMYPVIEMSWEGWRSLYPDSKVVSPQTGFARNYSPDGDPYRGYDRLDNLSIPFPMPINVRRPPKERVLGVFDGLGGLAFPFGELDEQPVRVVKERLGDEEFVVFWDRERAAAMAYLPHVDDDTLAFEVREGAIFDKETSSRWEVDGRSVAGPRSGAQLEPLAEAYVAFWFAWDAFQPETRLWSSD